MSRVPRPQVAPKQREAARLSPTLQTRRHHPIRTARATKSMAARTEADQAARRRTDVVEKTRRPSRGATRAARARAMAKHVVIDGREAEQERETDTQRESTREHKCSHLEKIDQFFIRGRKRDTAHLERRRTYARLRFPEKAAHLIARRF